MLAAAAVGYAETAFVTEYGVDGDRRRIRVRYSSPVAEVPFCGYATVALAVALSVRDGAGSFTSDTPVGPVVIETSGDGADITASFTAVEPQLAAFDEAVLAELLGLLGAGRATVLGYVAWPAVETDLPIFSMVEDTAAHAGLQAAQRHPEISCRYSKWIIIGRQDIR